MAITELKVNREVEKIYWSIGEVAELLTVETSTLRFWEMKFGIQTATNKKGERKYTKQDIEMMKQVKWLCRRFKLKFVRTILNNNKEAQIINAVKEILAQ